MDKINLEKIIRSHFKAAWYDRIDDLIMEQATPDDITSIIKEVCRQVLERAAENASVDKIRLGIFYAPEYAFVANRESILNTINEVE